MQLSLAEWQLIVSLINTAVLGVFTYLLWKATDQAAKASNIMSKLQQESEKMKKDNERRTLIYELIDSFYALDRYQKWLEKFQENLNHNEPPKLSPLQQFPAWAPISEKDVVYCSGVMNQCLYFMLGKKFTDTIDIRFAKNQEARELSKKLDEVQRIYQETFEQLMSESLSGQESG